VQKSADMLAEKCFVDPVLPPPPHAHDAAVAPSTQPHTQAQTSSSSEYPSSSTTLLGDRAQAQWGLTISGFYYVALHRQSGRIEGLYYDSRSQPYQSLKMRPEGSGEPDREDELVGPKMFFPAVEFR
jgi:hypothetical protein